MKIGYGIVAFLIIFLYVSFSPTVIQKAEGKEISREVEAASK